MGAGTAVFGGAVARPVVVHAVKAGMNVHDFASDAYDQAKLEVGRIKNEAASLRAGIAGPGLSELTEELRNLRQEIAALKAGLSKKPAGA